MSQNFQVDCQDNDCPASNRKTKSFIKFCDPEMKSSLPPNEIIKVDVGGRSRDVYGYYHYPDSAKMGALLATDYHIPIQVHCKDKRKRREGKRPRRH